MNLIMKKRFNYLNNLIMKKLLPFSAVILLLFAGCTKQDFNEDSQGNYQSGYTQEDSPLKSTGSNNGYFWSLYQEGGSASISFGSGGNFAISYSNVNDVVGGKGWNPGSSSRNIGYNIGSLSGSYNFVGVYGWTTNPLIEYYVAEKGSVTGGTSIGSVSANGHTYSSYTQQRVNAPSIQGTQTFWQYKDTWGGAPTGSNQTVSMSPHVSHWQSAGGHGWGSNNYQILALEAWGGKSGYINATVWDAGGGSSSGGSSGGGGSCTLTLRARSTDGQGQVHLIVGGNTVGTWTLGTSYGTHSVTLWSSRGDARVEFFNDASGRDVQVDYLSVCGSTRQAESQGTNTGVWQNGSCGGSYSEWLHCNGYIDFGNVSY
jgi:endo-1,4-beta-xylanase